MREPGSRSSRTLGRGARRESTGTEGGGGNAPPPSPVELAIRHLGPRRRFEREVRAFLRKKGVGREDADAALVRLKELGLVNDAETARAWVRDRLRFGPKGRGLLRVHLLRLGVEPNVADEALGAVLVEAPELETAVALAEKLAGRGGRAEPEALRRRMWSALARRGFDSKTVREAVARVLGAGADEESA